MISGSMVFAPSIVAEADETPKQKGTEEVSFCHAKILCEARVSWVPALEHSRKEGWVHGRETIGFHPVHQIGTEEVSFCHAKILCEARVSWVPALEHSRKEGWVHGRETIGFHPVHQIGTEEVSFCRSKKSQ